MRKRSLRKLAPFAVVVALLLAVACGGGDDEETSASTGTTTSGTQTEAAASTTTESTSTTTTTAAATTASTTTAQATETTAAAAVAEAGATLTTFEVGKGGEAVISINPDLGEPVFGGTINRRSFSSFKTIDTWVSDFGGATSTMYAQILYEALLTYDAPFDPEKGVVLVPNLAKDWSFSDDGSLLTIHLREGVTWHDGTPFTSADVAATFNRCLDPEFTASGESANKCKDLVQSVQVVDTHTIVLDLGGPSYIILPWLANPQISMVASHILDRDGDTRDADMGTGPYLSTEKDTETGMTFVKNPNYWGRDDSGRQLPYMDAMNRPVIREKATALALMLAGNLDTYEHWPVIEQIEAEGVKNQLGDKVDVRQVNPGVWHNLILNAGKPPFDNIKVRQALNYAIDRTLATRAGYGDPPFGGIPGHILDPRDFGDFALTDAEIGELPGFNPARRAEDLDRARQLMADAGYVDGVELTEGFIVAPSPRDVDLMSNVAEQLAEIGIDTKVEVLDFAVINPRQLDGAYNASKGAWATIIADPLGVLDRVFTKFGRPNGYTFWDTSEWDAWWIKATRTLDTEERRASIKDAQKRWLTDDGISNITLLWATNNVPFYTHVKNYFQPGPTFYGNWSFRHVWLER